MLELFAPFALITPPAPPPTSIPGREPAPYAAPARAEAPRRDENEDRRRRDRWLLSLEGAVHAPADLGVRTSMEFPFRLRLTAGVGYMPVDWVAGFIGRATTDPNARAVLDLPSYSGTIWRVQAGFRPLPKAGLYLDAGYAHADIDGSFDLSGSPLADDIGVRGGYAVDVALHLWLLEAGYQWQIARRGVVALGLGVMSTFSADTTIAATGGAPTSSEFTEGTERANDAFERYGTLPFLTLRAGVDFL